MNIIECTIKMRKEAQAHYKNLSLAVADKELKRLFALLAAAEDEHIDVLKGINETVLADSKDDNLLEGSVCVYRPELSAGSLESDLLNDHDAYRHLMKEGEETIEFFDRMAEGTDRTVMRKACQSVAVKEREHLQQVENIYAFVEETRTYLEWGEFSNLKSL